MTDMASMLAPQEGDVESLASSLRKACDAHVRKTERRAQNEKALLERAAEKAAHKAARGVPARLRVTARGGGREAEICFMYVPGYNPRKYPHIPPYEVALTFGRKCVEKVAALDPSLNVGLKIERWGRDSAYPLVTISW